MINKIILQNLRNFMEKSFEFSDKTTVIVGPNASGKTNVIESIFLLSTGKSFKAKLEEEMVNYESDICRVKGSHFADASRDKLDLEVVLTRGEIKVGESKIEKVPRKKLLVNGVSRRLIDFVGNLKVVLFAPQHLELVTGSPIKRRDFLDTVLSQVNREYRRASLSYEKGLRQRNKLLFRIREEGLSRSQLLFWDRLLIKNGDYISTKREEFIEFVNNKNFKFQISNFKLEYDKSAISESRLEQYAEEEIAAATTLVGPHRDDFIFKITNHYSPITKHRELARYGSRGEQRMGVLWLKLAELAFIEEKTKEKPTLLLDDIFSELDHEHREIVMEIVKGQQTPIRSSSFGGQAIITTTDPHFVEEFGKIEEIEL